MSASFALRAFFGHHKCATSWIDTILMDVCFHMGLNLEIVHREVEFADQSSLSAYVDVEDTDFLAYTNAKVEHVQNLSFQRGFHVVRDPRDVLVSAYFSHLHSHPTANWPELSPHRERLSSLSKEEGLFAEMDFSAEEFEDMYRWDYSRDDILELKMEDLTAGPLAGYVQIFDFLNMIDYQTSGLRKAVKSATLKANRLLYKGRHVLPTDHPPTVQRHHSLSEDKVQSIVEKNSFSRLSGGREKGKENVKSHFRKGVPGDWVNHFTPEHKLVFKERFNDVLVKLGYEEDSSW